MSNWGAELRASVGVWEGEVKTGLHYPDGAGGEDKALKVEAGHENFHACVEVAEAVLGCDVDVFEDELASVGPSHTEFIEFPSAGEAGGGFCFDDKGSDTFAAGLRVCFGVDDNVVGIWAVGDPHFTPIEEPSAIVGLLCSGLHANDVGACGVFGHSEGADLGPCD